MTFDRKWFWRKKLPERKGQRCRILARSLRVSDAFTAGRISKPTEDWEPKDHYDAGTVLVEFEDGLKVTTSFHAVRLCRNMQEPHADSPEREQASQVGMQEVHEDESPKCPAGHALVHHERSDTYSCSEANCIAWDRYEHARRMYEARMRHEPGCPVRAGQIDAVCLCAIIRGEEEPFDLDGWREAQDEADAA